MKKLLVITAVISLLYACSKHSSDDATTTTTTTTSGDCSGPAKSFAADVNSIIQTSCSFNSGCHGNGSGNGPGALLTYTQIFNARSIIRSEVASGRMPLNSSLPASQKNAILCWIDNGAANN
jgi:hypothetical protein